MGIARFRFAAGSTEGLPASLQDIHNWRMDFEPMRGIWRVGFWVMLREGAPEWTWISVTGEPECSGWIML
jgi:hypothetical protein